MSRAIIEYYKQFVDREALRENLKLTVTERLQKLEAEARHRDKIKPPRRPSVMDVHPGWEPVSDCGPNRTTDPVIELYKRDVDRTLLRANLQRTVTERLQGLQKMAELDEAFRMARENKKD